MQRRMSNSSSSSSLFTPYRSVGVVCNSVPPVVRFHPGHREFYVSTVAERRLLTFKVSNVGLKTVSDPFPEEVTCLTQHKGHVIAGGSLGGVFVVRNSREVTAPDGDARCPPGGGSGGGGGGGGLRFLESFGHLLVGVTADNRMHTWRMHPDIVVGELIASVELDSRSFPVSALCHPYLYTNKIVLGSCGSDSGGGGGGGMGQLQLWNVAKARMVHAFQPLEAGVTCLTQAPAEDLMAVGLVSGLILLHHLRRDLTLMRLRQDFGPVAGLAFRTDGHPIMLSGSRQGQITVWHLEDKRVCGLMQDAHPSAAIVSLACLHSQPLAVTTGSDNCLRVWLFDRPDSLPRLLHQRAGHSAPPADARFYAGGGVGGAFGADILSAGLDSGVRLFSLEREALSRCLGKGKRSNKSLGTVLPPVRHFACEPARHGDWCTMIACHAGTRLATTWDVRKGCQGQLRLEPQVMTAKEAVFKTAEAACVDLSNCGNFALIGYTTGHVIRYNIQSGREAKRPYVPALPAPAICVRCDAHNRMVLAVSAEAHVFVYAFKKAHRLVRLKAFDQPAAGATAAELHRPSGLVAVAGGGSGSGEGGGSSWEIRLYQLGPSMAQPVRVLPCGVGGGGGSPVSLLRFSPDGAWLMAGSGAVLFTYSVLQGCLIDRLDCGDSPIACFDMSPTGDLLVTGHRDRLGLQVWVNSTLFKPLITCLTADTVGATTTTLAAAAAEEGMVTLTGLPPGRWQCLIDLDSIRARNAVHRPLVPKTAPFFLTAGAAAPAASTNAAAELADDSSKADALEAVIGDKSFMLSDLSNRLLKAVGDSPDDLVACIAHLETLNPTAIDSEIRDLADDAFPAFMEAVAACLGRGVHFETSQAYLAVFLTHHGVAMATAAAAEADATAAAAATCRSTLDRLRRLQRQVWSRVAAEFQETDCLLGYTRDGVIGHAM